MPEKIFKVGVRAIIEKENKLLFIKRNEAPHKDKWCLPGGHMHFDEMIEEAVVREVKEETGLTIKPSFLFFNENINEEPNKHWVIIYFHAMSQEKPKLNQREASEYKYFSEKELDNIDLAWDQRKMLKKFFTKSKK